MDTVLEVLKWVGIVLAAGFIGYFGRYLAMLIIDRVRKRRPHPTPPHQSTAEVVTGKESRLEESALKLEKKKAKQEAKKAKKEQKK